MPVRARSDRALPLQTTVATAPLVTAAGAGQAARGACANTLGCHDSHTGNMTRPGGRVSSHRAPKTNTGFVSTGRL